VKKAEVAVGPSEEVMRRGSNQEVHRTQGSGKKEVDVTDTRHIGGC